MANIFYRIFILKHFYKVGTSKGMQFTQVENSFMLNTENYKTKRKVPMLKTFVYLRKLN